MRSIPQYMRFPSIKSEKKDILLGLVLVLIVAFLYYVQWGYYLTSVKDSKVSIDYPQKYFWWADDSRDYKLTGDWIFGRSKESLIDVRPWLYPFFVGVVRAFYNVNPEKLLWIIQFLMWMMSIILIYLTLYNSTKRVLLGIIGAVLFFSHPSPLILTYHGMTETLNILLLCVLSWLLSANVKGRYFYLVLTLSLLTVTKPTYQIQLILFSLYVTAKTVFREKRILSKQAGLLILALIPIFIQFAFSYAYDRSMTFSKIGGNTFKYFYVAVVYQNVEDKPWRQSMEEIKNWDIEKQINYIWHHQREALLTYRRNLIDTNQWVGSFFIRGENNRMTGFVETYNSISLYAHLLFIPIIFYYLLSEKYKANKELVMVIYLIFLIQTIISGISTGQDDRLTMTGIPLWIIAYMVVAFSVRAARENEAVVL